MITNNVLNITKPNTIWTITSAINPTVQTNSILKNVFVYYHLQVNNVSVLLCTLTNQISIPTFAQQMPFEQSDRYTISQEMFLKTVCIIMVELCSASNANIKPINLCMFITTQLQCITALGSDTPII